MKILWTPFAASDRDAILEHIASDTLNAALRVDQDIESQVDLLARSPRLGRPGRISGTRELVIAGTPYLVAYALRNDAVEVLRVLHGAQTWPEQL